MDKQYENLPGDVKDGGGSFLNGDSLSSLIIKNVLPIMCCIIFRAMTQLIRWVLFSFLGTSRNNSILHFSWSSMH